MLLRISDCDDVVFINQQQDVIILELQARDFQDT